MKIIAIETATEACSAALYLNGEVLERHELAPREHNRLILPMVESLLQEAGLVLAQMDALAFGRGPGSFTGVRIATGVAQGLAFAVDLPVAPVSTLAAMALQAFDECTVDHAFACIDARMGEVYWGIYRRDGQGVETVTAEAVVPPEAVDVPPVVNGVGIGSGWATYEDVLRQRVGMERISTILRDRFPRAAQIARLGAEIFQRGGCVSAELALPVYLRDQVAKKPSSGG